MFGCWVLLFAVKADMSTETLRVVAALNVVVPCRFPGPLLMLLLTDALFEELLRGHQRTK